MAVNPMQRKSRNSFLLGMIITLLVTGIIIVLLFLQLKSAKDEQAAEAATKVNVYTLTQDVKSGQVITQDMFTMLAVSKKTVPSNATSVLSVIDSWYLQTKDGTMIFTDKDGLYYLDANGNQVRVYQEPETANYYILKTVNREEVKEYIELNNVPVVAKVDLKANTVMTPSLVVQSDQVITNDIRKEQYNMISLPVDLMTGDYVDIRLKAPNGQNFIVVSKKMVEVPMNADGTYIPDTIAMNLREDEILAISSAIVEAYGMQGAILYANKYTEPGMQDAATPTYRPSNAVTTLIGLASDGTITNPNIIEEAKAELRKRYSSVATDARANHLQPAINGDATYDSNVQSGMSEGATNDAATRKKYLESLQY